MNKVIVLCWFGDWTNMMSKIEPQAKPSGCDHTNDSAFIFSCFMTFLSDNFRQIFFKRWNALDTGSRCSHSESFLISLVRTIYEIRYFWSFRSSLKKTPNPCVDSCERFKFRMKITNQSFLLLIWQVLAWSRMKSHSSCPIQWCFFTFITIDQNISCSALHNGINLTLIINFF